MSLTPAFGLVICPVASAPQKLKERHSFAFIQVFPAVSVRNSAAASSLSLWGRTDSFIYYFQVFMLLQSFFSLLNFPAFWPVWAPSSWPLRPLGRTQVVFDSSLAFCLARCSSRILCTSLPSSEISHFSRKPCFFPQEMVF